MEATEAKVIPHWTFISLGIVLSKIKNAD